MVVKTNMTNALKSLNLEHRSIYGDDIGGIDNMLGQAAHDHKEWIKGMGKVTGIVGGALQILGILENTRFGAYDF